jgi:collagenase-like PrtC family protease
MSAVIGQRSGNRGKCAQPCRLPYFMDGKQAYPLSLKDLFLGDELDRIKAAGVTSLKIEGRMKRAEYVALVTKAYKNAIKGIPFSQKEKEMLSNIFSRSGFTNGYFTNKTGKNMFGIRSDEDKEKTNKALSKTDLQFESKALYTAQRINREVKPIILDVKKFGSQKPPLLEARFYKIEQVSVKGLSKVWLPISEIIENKEKIKALLNKGVIIGAELPRFLLNENKKKLSENLEQIKLLGINEVLCGNYGILNIANEKGFILNGDFGLNIFNSFSVNEAKEQGLHSATLSFELSFPQIRDMNKALNCGIIGYGYLPLMIFRNCIIKNADKCGKCGGEFSLKDRKGERFPVLKEFGCFNALLNSKPLYIADKEETKKTGLSFIRLYFTTESQKYCENIIGHYLSGALPEKDFTRGLYIRGVQ